MDVTKYIQAKSDQLNADDLLGGPITVRIDGASQGNAEQPVQLQISGGHCPWRPCKTSLRMLVAAWGKDASQWVGRWVRLYRDPAVRFGGQDVGGIRISALSDIERPMTLSLAVSRGKKAAHKVDVIRADEQKQNGAPTANLDALLEEHGLTRDDVDRWRAANDKGPLSDLTPEQVAKLAGWLAADSKRLEEISALVPAETNQ